MLKFANARSMFDLSLCGRLCSFEIEGKSTRLIEIRDCFVRSLAFRLTKLSWTFLSLLKFLASVTRACEFFATSFSGHLPYWPNFKEFKRQVCCCEHSWEQIRAVDFSMTREKSYRRIILFNFRKEKIVSTHTKQTLISQSHQSRDKRLCYASTIWRWIMSQLFCSRNFSLEELAVF